MYLQIALIAIIILFCMALYALILQVFGIDSVNKATIIGGVLSMVGGAFGAFGAYIVATYQMKKQFQKQDNDRVLEMRINKLTDTLGIAYEFLHKLQGWYGLINSIEINTKEKIDLGHTHITESNIFVQYDANHLFNQIKEIVYFKDALKKNYIFFVNAIELQEIYDNTSYVVESNKKFLGLLDFKKNTSIQVSNIIEDFHKKNLDVGNSYRQLDNSIRQLITALEDEINILFNNTLYKK